MCYIFDHQYWELSESQLRVGVICSAFHWNCKIVQCYSIGLVDKLFKIFNVLITALLSDKTQSMHFPATVQLVPYKPDLEETVLWSESKEVHDGYRFA
ncbi:hypothetical protein V6N13_131458 [Hibiscus sabdariffa]|uniref:Uncharacterized protein n=1 Tax=Hibiscus sabdariffa TaxID=183260 RepID=A0ABR2D7Y0_9ROSI